MQRKSPRLYDKNASKKNLKKYFIMLVCLIPVLAVLNLTVLVNMSSTLRIIIDVVVTLALVFLIDSLLRAKEEKSKDETKEKK